MPAIPLVRFSKELPAGDLAELNAPENIKTSTLERERERKRGPDECLVDVADAHLSSSHFHSSVHAGQAQHG